MGKQQSNPSQVPTSLMHTRVNPDRGNSPRSDMVAKALSSLAIIMTIMMVVSSLYGRLPLPLLARECATHTGITAPHVHENVGSVRGHAARSQEKTSSPHAMRSNRRKTNYNLPSGETRWTIGRLDEHGQPDPSWQRTGRVGHGKQTPPTRNNANNFSCPTEDCFIVMPTGEGQDCASPGEGHGGEKDGRTDATSTSSDSFAMVVRPPPAGDPTASSVQNDSDTFVPSPSPPRSRVASSPLDPQYPGGEGIANFQYPRGEGIANFSEYPRGEGITDFPERQEYANTSPLGSLGASSVAKAPATISSVGGGCSRAPKTARTGTSPTGAVRTPLRSYPIASRAATGFKDPDDDDDGSASSNDDPNGSAKSEGSSSSQNLRPTIPSSLELDLLTEGVQDWHRIIEHDHAAHEGGEELARPEIYMSEEYTMHRSREEAAALPTKNGYDDRLLFFSMPPDAGLHSGSDANKRDEREFKM